MILGDQRVLQAAAANLNLILHHTYWWPTGESGMHPSLTTLSYLFNYAILGNSNHPAGYLWVNFFLDAVNVLLVFALCLRLLAGRARAFRTRSSLRCCGACTRC